MTTKRGQKNTTEEIKTTLIEIPTDNITSGKSELSIFNLTFKKKRITTPFFPTIHNKPEYDYEHHIDGERLEQMKEKYPDFNFFSFEKRGETENFKNITIDSYGKLMKYELYRLITSGKLEHIQDHENEKTIYRQTWTGNPIEEPTIKQQEPKKKKEKTEQPKLDGLNFFN